MCYTSPFLVKSGSTLMRFHLTMNLLHPIMKTIMAKETRKFFLKTHLSTNLQGTFMHSIKTQSSHYLQQISLKWMWSNLMRQYPSNLKLFSNQEGVKQDL